MNGRISYPMIKTNWKKCVNPNCTLVGFYEVDELHLCEYHYIKLVELLRE